MNNNEKITSTPLPLFDSSILRLVKSIRAGRRLRQEFIDPDLLGEPAWDMLLYLYEQELRQRRVAITRLSEAAGIPQTTVIRWLATMETKGLIRRAADPLDGRRVFVGLTPHSMCILESLFAELEKRLTVQPGD